MRTTMTMIALVMVGCASSPPPVTTGPGEPQVPVGTPAAPAAATVVDTGVLMVSIGGQAAGQERFTLSRTGTGWSLAAATKLTVAGETTATEGTLETDGEFRPRAGKLTVTGASIQGEVELSVVQGTPQIVSRFGGGEPHTQRASRAIDLFLADTLLSHLLPLCRGSAEARTIYVFPGAAVKVGAAVPVPEHAEPPPSTTRRDLDVGGDLSLALYCDGDRLLAVDVPLQGLIAVRQGEEARFEQLRIKPREKPALPEGLVELARKVEVPATAPGGAATLGCTLLVPSASAAIVKRPKRGALPAVVFITGSGKQDRDEDSYGPGGLKLAIFKTIAIELGKAGIASLRCDDRGGGESTGDFTAATLDTFVADTSAAVAALRAEPAIDPARIGLVGHSEGGIVAPLVATRDPRLRALVLMAGTGRTLDLIILEQLERGLRHGGLTDDDLQARLARTRAVFAAIRDGKPLPDDVPADERAQWAAGQAWLASHFKHDPALTAAKLGKVAVLIAQGARDQQVAIADAEALKAAFAKAHNPRVEYKVYPDLNHLFAHTETGDLAEYASPTAAVDEQFLRDLVGFLGKRLK